MTPKQFQRGDSRFAGLRSRPVYLTGPVLAGALQAAEVDQLRQLSLRELMEVQVVTSAAKKEQKLTDTAAAITVITQDDLQRSGVTKFQDALRLVPGVEVGRVTGKDWAITARGFNDTFANKLLVMVNGRSVYTPLFSGVFWDAQNFLVEDLDRIEVIRGPGASVWGANAVNGVINIITKDARDTVGGAVNLGGGNLDNFIGELRQGWQVGPNSWLRAYGKFEQRGEGLTELGLSAEDDYQFGLGGWRYDWHPTESGHLTLEAEGFGGAFGGTQISPQVTPPYYTAFAEEVDTEGGHVLGRWTSAIDDTSEFTLQAYYDYTGRTSTDLDEFRHTGDFDAGYRVQLGERHDLNLGLNYRFTHAELPPQTPNLIFATRNEAYQLVSAYAQDDWKLIPGTLTLTAGSKFEHNSYTGLEIQPTARLLWSPSAAHSVWGSVSRAVRTPSRVEDSGRLIAAVQPPSAATGGLPAVITLEGSQDFLAEELLAYELGYRFQPTPALAFDLALFAHDYDRLRGLVPGTPYPELGGTPRLIVPYWARNDTRGVAYGAELAARWQVADWWQWRLAYTGQEMDLRGSLTTPAGFSPRHRVSLHSLLTLPHHVEIDAVLRAVDELPGPGVPAYVTTDLRIAWRPRPNLELSIIGRDLFDGHVEFPANDYFKSNGWVVTERTVFGRLRWEF